MLNPYLTLRISNTGLSPPSSALWPRPPPVLLWPRLLFPQTDSCNVTYENRGSSLASKRQTTRQPSHIWSCSAANREQVARKTLRLAEQPLVSHEDVAQPSHQHILTNADAARLLQDKPSGSFPCRIIDYNAVLIE